MNVNHILQRFIEKVTPLMHKTRRQALIDCTKSLLNGSFARVTSIGRGISSSAYEKHSIKRADRLLSNKHLQYENLNIYRKISEYLIGERNQPIILVDWSDLDAYKRHFLIRAAITFSGRSITLYEEVHDIKTKEKPQTHKQFLTRLKSIIPQHCKPIVITDAGFKTPWFRLVLSLGWDFLGRTRLPNFYSENGDDWQCITTLYGHASKKPVATEGYIARRNPLKCRIISVKKPPKGRKVFNRSGLPVGSKKNNTYRKSGRDPWVLSTSLSLCSKLAKRAVSLYSFRMQIEESFRDMKDPQTGLGFIANSVSSKLRLGVMMLLIALANTIAILIGVAAVVQGVSRQFQVNTRRNRKEISLHFLGLRIIARKSFQCSLFEYINIQKVIHQTGNLSLSI